MQWNLHGKHLSALKNLLDKLEDPFDLLCLQEVGGFSHLPDGESIFEAITLSGVPYKAYVYQAPQTHRCVAILIREDLDINISVRHLFGTGFLVQGRAMGRTFWLGSAHLPHQQRPDSEECWLASLARLDEILAAARYQDVILLGLDANQDPLNSNPHFPALSRLQFLARHRGLEFNMHAGPTWEARGEFSTIDWFLFRWPMMEILVHLRPDLRTALPSDHNPLVACFTGRSGLKLRPRRPRHGCGRWSVPDKPLRKLAQDSESSFDPVEFAKVCRQHGTRLPNRRYKDPPQVMDLIRQRKLASDPQERTRLSAEVLKTRTEAQKQHKLDLLQAARSGDKGAIAHLRRSASQTHSDGSLIERLGGEDAAFRAFHSFYEAKYSRSVTEPEVSLEQEQALFQRHQQDNITKITPQEVSEALSKTKPSTASGLDSVCYSAISTYHSADEEGKLAAFFTKILKGEAPVPKDWLVGKICFLPKIPRPGKVKDLRPISLTPCLGKLYSKILVTRLRSSLPEYRAGQHACRPGTQALEAITAAQAALKIHRQATGKQLLVAKLDISQAFDTISHQAIWRYLVDARPSQEALALWRMCRNTQVQLQIGSRSWSQALHRGVLQGTSFSADLFSRVLDYFVGGLVDKWVREENKTFKQFCIPHALLFADDILLFAPTSAEMQQKLRALQVTLRSIGLHLNLAKCSVLDGEDGVTPGIWGTGATQPLQGSPSLVYLGVPLAYKSNPLGQLGVSLAKVSASFFGLRRLFDHPETPVSEKLALFQTYITSKWAWCSPAVFPSRKALRSLEAFKHTLLLSLLKIQIDPLQPFLVNTIARRRSVKVLCEVLGSQRWGQVWLSRLWTFWGHALRSRQNLPLRHLLNKCSSFRVLSGRVAASCLQDFLPRKLQLAWNRLREGSPFPDVESLAQDRDSWSQVLPKWLHRWGYGGSDIAKLPDNYLHDRQLLVVGSSLAILRPARVFPDEPYSRELQHVQVMSPCRTCWTVWCMIMPEGTSVTLLPPQNARLKTCHLQQLCNTRDMLSRRLALWDTLHVLWDCYPELQDNRACCLLPLEAFAPHVFCHQVPLPLLSQVHSLERREVEVDFLQYCHLQPRKTPAWIERLLPEILGPFPGDYKFLVRTCDFATARYYSQAPRSL